MMKFDRFGRSAVILALIAAPSMAPAAVTATLVENRVEVNEFDVFTTFDPGDLDGPVIDASGAFFVPQGEVPYGGLTVDALSDLSPTQILFKNGVIGSGISASATIGVDITYTNTYDFAFRPTLLSTLLAAGTGMTMTNFTNYFDGVQGDTTSCLQDQLKNCGQLNPDLYGIGGIAGQVFGESSTGFAFDVSVGGNSIYNLSGSLELTESGFVENFNGADQVLRNFIRSENEPGVAAYTWDDTLVEIDLPDMLNPGESVTARYTITTFIDIGTGTFLDTENNPEDGLLKLIGFSSFGDPTGGKNPINTRGSLDDPMEPGVPDLTLNGFTRFLLPTEVVDPLTGEVTIVFLGQTTFVGEGDFPYGPPNGGVVPEPASWAMLIAGFGLVGGALRRRPQRTALTA